MSHTKDICPKCGELKPIRQMSYSKYAQVCIDCERGVPRQIENPIYAMLLSIMFMFIILFFFKLEYQDKQIADLRRMNAAQHIQMQNDIEMLKLTPIHYIEVVQP
jgi:hypothetical protein